MRPVHFSSGRSSGRRLSESHLSPLPRPRVDRKVARVSSVYQRIGASSSLARVPGCVVRPPGILGFFELLYVLSAPNWPMVCLSSSAGWAYAAHLEPTRPPRRRTSTIP